MDILKDAGMRDLRTEWCDSGCGCYTRSDYIMRPGVPSSLLSAFDL